MRFDFQSDALCELFETGSCNKLRLPYDLIRAFFKTMQLIQAAPDERFLRNIHGLHMEKLSGDRKGQYSLRLNDQYRLIFAIKKDEDGNYLMLIEIVDYH